MFKVTLGHLKWTIECPLNGETARVGEILLQNSTVSKSTISVMMILRVYYHLLRYST